MDIEHCVIAELSSEVAKFRIAADKRRYNVLSICPVAHPFTLADFGVFDVAKIHIFPDITRKRNPRQHKPAGKYGQKDGCLANYVSAMLSYV